MTAAEWATIVWKYVHLNMFVYDLKVHSVIQHDPLTSGWSAVLPTRSAKEIERTREIDRLLAILHQWGIHTVGQLAKLERNDLAARLGGRAIELWERANGRSQRMLKLISPPEIFAESFEFENEIETSEPLLFMLRRFLQQLATRLSAIYLVAQELRL